MSVRVGLSILSLLVVVAAPVSAQSVSGKSLADYMATLPSSERAPAYQASASVQPFSLPHTAAVPAPRTLPVSATLEVRPVSLVAFPDAPDYNANPEPAAPTCAGKPCTAKPSCAAAPPVAAPTCQAQAPVAATCSAPLRAAPACGFQAAAPRCGTAATRAGTCQPLGGLFSGLRKGGCGNAAAAKVSCTAAPPTCAAPPSCASAPSCAAKPAACGKN